MKIVGTTDLGGLWALKWAWLLCAKRQKYAQIMNLTKLFTLRQITIEKKSIHDYRRLVSSGSRAA